MSIYRERRKTPSAPHRCAYTSPEDYKQCGNQAMHNNLMCHLHRLEDIPEVIENSPFEIAHLDDRAAIQQALADTAARLACNNIDLKRAELLLNALRTATSNLGAYERNQEKHRKAALAEAKARLAAQQTAKKQAATSQPADTAAADQPQPSADQPQPAAGLIAPRFHCRPTYVAPQSWDESPAAANPDSSEPSSAAEPATLPSLHAVAADFATLKDECPRRLSVPHVRSRVRSPFPATSPSRTATPCSPASPKAPHG